MDNVIKFKRPKLREKFKGNTLCKNGHHKWRVVKERTFDTKQGKLVTTFRCERCNKIINRAT